MSKTNNHNNIIRGSKHSKHEESHGSHGMWKIAYADFMTAMMAFFLMMWLTSSVAENIRKGIANYFAPIGVSVDILGTDSVLDGGESLEKLGNLDNMTLEQTIFSQTINYTTTAKSKETSESKNQQTDPTNSTKQQSDANKNASKEQEIFKEAQKTLKESLLKDPDLQKISDSVLIDITDEGLKIELVDKDGMNMFAVGSKQMLDHMKLALTQIVKVISVLPNNIKITGHTDARPYGANATYNNWDLSTDRALESRRFVAVIGFPEAKIASVVGKASNDPLNPEDPFAPANRRISILVLRNTPIPERKIP
jgi:chemotaxis protein MotB